MMAALGDRPGAAVRAVRMSSFERGEPVKIVRPGRGERLPDVRTRATAVWF